jgi:hypothetical protein
MSRLGDLIVDHGPYDGISPPLSVRSYAMQADELNALRDELIALRAAAVDACPQQCQEETYSWQHFTPEQVDAYWIRCTLQGEHAEHEDEHTGLTWVSPATPDSDSPDDAS